MSFPRLDIQISLHNDLKLHNGETPLWLVQPLPFHAISASSSTWKTLTARMANASCIPRWSWSLGSVSHGKFRG